MPATIDALADIDLELFGAGEFRTLERILASAEAGDADYDVVAARIGAALKASGSFRAGVKLASGWNDSKTAWESLRKFIAANRSNKPWWAILAFADGEPVSPDVQSFFAA